MKFATIILLVAAYICTHYGVTLLTGNTQAIIFEGKYAPDIHYRL